MKLHLEEDKDKASRKLPVPLVVEVLPGQAAEGLLELFEPGTYEGRTLQELVHAVLSRQDLSVEEREILEEIVFQMENGVLLCAGRPAEGDPLERARVEETEEGEKYYYVAVRALRPQEGGAPKVGVTVNGRRRTTRGARFFDNIEVALLDWERMFLPCPMDPQIFEELTAFEPSSGAAEQGSGRAFGPRLIWHEGTVYVETVPWADVVRHAPELFPHLARKRRRAWFRDLRTAQRPGVLSFDAQHVQMLLFEVLPRFVRVPSDINSARNRAAALAAWLAQKVPVPTRYFRWAEEMGTVHEAERARTTWGPENVMEDYSGQRVSVHELMEAVEAALTSQWEEMVLAQHSRIRESMRLFAQWPVPARALILYVLTQGALEVQGFGFFHRPFDGALVVYKRTGRYALMDYYQRLYLFADCRVAVSSMDLWPVVVEKYKHPLLPRHQPWQRICLGRPPRGRTFSAPDIFRSIEDGLNALYHGYDARKRNGYHSLDRLSGMEREIHFDNLRVSAQDARLLENIPVTNAWA